MMTDTQRKDGRSEMLGQDLIRRRIDIAELGRRSQSLGKRLGQVRRQALQQLFCNRGRFYVRGGFTESDNGLELW